MKLTFVEVVSTGVDVLHYFDERSQVDIGGRLFVMLCVGHIFFTG